MGVIKKLFVMMLCCTLISCAHKAAQTQTQHSPSGLKWTAAELEGKTWQLVDYDTIENMNFYPKGYLPITLGVKSTTGSTIMAPIFHWSIDEDGGLVITDNKKRIYKKIYKVEDDPYRVTVKVNGKIQHYDKLQQ